MGVLLSYLYPKPLPPTLSSGLPGGKWQPGAPICFAESSSSSSQPASPSPPASLSTPGMSAPRRKALPKAWSSAQAQRAGYRDGNKFRSYSSAAKTAKELQQVALEEGLEAYTYTSPVGSALDPFVNSTSSSKGDRLGPPALAYTQDLAEAEDLVSCLRGPLGLDLEWNFARGKIYKTALLQICSSSLIVIVQVSSTKVLPPTLIKLLQDLEVIKTGVAIRNDALKLQKDFNIECRNIVELSALAKLAEPERWKEVRHLISLRDLTRVYTGQKLKKDKVRTSDWTRSPLSEKQIEYAASDVFVGLEILRKLATFFPSDPDKTLVEQLDDLQSKIKGKQALKLPLSKALKLCSQDLYLERTALASVERQKQALRTVQVQAVKSDSDDDFVMTKAMLAHDRALHAWLSESLSIQQLALRSNIKPSTAAAYLVKALVQGRGKEFTEEQRNRLNAEMKQGGKALAVSQKWFRGVARGLGWFDGEVS